MDKVHVNVARSVQASPDILGGNGRIGHALIGAEPQRILQMPGNSLSFPIRVRGQKHFLSLPGQSGQFFQHIRPGFRIPESVIRRFQAIALVRQVTHMAATGGNAPFRAKNILQFLDLAGAFHNQQLH